MDLMDLNSWVILTLWRFQWRFPVEFPHGAFPHPWRHCARTVEDLERKVISDKMPRQILELRLGGGFSNTLATQKTSKTYLRKAVNMES